MNIRLTSLFPFFILLLFQASPVLGSQQDVLEARTVAHRFFTLVYRGNYPEAYEYFSTSVKQQVSFPRFVQGAQDVRYLKVLEIKVLDREENLIKMEMTALMHLIYKGYLYEAVYKGELNLYKEKGKWKVMTVDLSAISQKSLSRKAPAEKLQRLDFGT